MIFSLSEGRDDSLPLLYLPTSKSWYRSCHVCPELPENNLENDDEGLAINYDLYDPTLHTRLEDHVVGDLSSNQQQKMLQVGQHRSRECQ